MVFRGPLAFPPHVNNDLEHHCGSVEEAQPDLGLFWVQDAITGRRRLVDFDSYEIFVDPDTGRPVASNTAKARA